MATATTDLKAMRTQLQTQIREHEVAIRNLQDSIRLLDNLPDILQGKAIAPNAERLQLKINTNMTATVRQWIDAFDGTGPLSVPDIVKHLQAQGARGKYRSLYSAVHVILRKESRPNGRVEYAKGKGFIKRAGAVGTNITNL